MALNSQTTSPIRLALELAIYFAILIGLIVVIVQIRPDVIRHLPIGGTHALGSLDVNDMRNMLSAGSLEKESAEKMLTSGDDAVK